MSEYQLRYLPLFEQDVNAVKKYISATLKNPVAAMNLIESTDEAIIKRLESPLGYEPYHSVRERKYPYYRIYVGNYIIFYVVIGNVMEVRRFIYSKRNLSEHI